MGFIILMTLHPVGGSRQVGLVRSIHLYSDSSPVTGEEFQGMLIDVCEHDGDHRRVTLPGASLFYGTFSVVQKSATLL